MQENNSHKNNRFLVRNEDLAGSDFPYLQETENNYQPNYYGDNPEGNDTQNILKFLYGLKKHWLMILGINLLITAIVIVYEAQKPDYYTAETRVQVNNEVNPAGNSVVYAYGNDPTYFATQLQIIEGSGLLRRVVKETDLVNNRAFLSANKTKDLTVWQNVLRMFGLYKPPVTDDQDTTASNENNSSNDLSLKQDNSADSDEEIEMLAPYVANLQGRIKVSPVTDKRTDAKETRLIDIDFTHSDPVIAAKMANTIADTYVLQNLEQKVQTNAEAGDFLQKRVAELQSAIRSGEERLLNYSKSNQIISLDAGQNTVVQRLGDLNIKLGQAENDRITAQAAYQAAIKNPYADVTAESKDSRTVAIETQLLTLRQRLGQLKTEYTDDWPEVIQVRQQIDGLEKELQTNRTRASSTQLAGLQQALNETSAKESELRNNFEQQRNEVLAQNQAAINYRIIQQEVDTNKSLLAGVLERSKANDIIMNEAPNNVRIVDRSLIPRIPAGPQRFRDVALAFVISLMFGVGLSFLLTWMNDILTSPEDVEAQTGLPILGLIPATQSSFVKKLMPKRFALSKSKPAAQNSYDLEKFEDPAIMESYLHLRTYLLLSTAGGPPQTIMITSGLPGEGKTVTAINLAKSLAQIDAKVLLIDADLRYPRLHSINNLSNEKGLSTLLTVKDCNEELINQTVQKDSNLNLDILTAGPNAPNPPNILGSKEMMNLLNLLRNQYSHIVIDSPPVLYFTDSSILSAFVDVVAIVARYNMSIRQSVLFAKKKLQEVGGKIIGIVFNGIPLKTQYYNYGYYRRLEPAASEEQSLLNLN